MCRPYIEKSEIDFAFFNELMYNSFFFVGYNVCVNFGRKVKNI